VTLDTHQRQVAAVALAYAVSFIERVPPHWIRPGLLYDLHCMLEKFTDDKPAPALKVARGHVSKLVGKPKLELH
jgi:hypothetical protein